MPELNFDLILFKKETFFVLFSVDGLVVGVSLSDASFFLVSFEASFS